LENKAFFGCLHLPKIIKIDFKYVKVIRQSSDTFLRHGVHC